MSLSQIAAKIETQMRTRGIKAEITFASEDMFSVFCESAKDFDKALALLAAANQKLLDTDSDEEIGHFAYYAF